MAINNNFSIYSANTKQGLHSVPVYIDDTSVNSTDYFLISDVPSPLCSGKNLIKIFGSTTRLVANSEIKLELIDASGNPLFLEYLNFTDRYGKKHIVAHVDSSTAHGVGLLTVLGVAAYDVCNACAIPHEWQNKFNVKWQQHVDIDIYQPNSSDIIFTRAPTVSITEWYKELPIPISIVTASITTAPIRIEAFSSAIRNADNYNDLYCKTPNDYNATTIYTTPQSTTTASYSTEHVVSFNRQSTDYNSLQRHSLSRQQSINAPGGLSILADTKFIYPSGTAIVTINTGEFDSRIIGGIIRIPGQSMELTQPPTGYAFYGASGVDYVAHVVDVINNTSIEVTPPFNRNIYDSTIDKSAVLISDIRNYAMPVLTASAYQATYSLDVSYSTSSVYQSMAHVKLYDINAAAGDVYKIKTYTKPSSTISNWVHVTDTIIGTTNLLIHSSSLHVENVGDISRGTLTAYWSSSISADTYANISYDATMFPAAMRVTSVNTFDSDGNAGSGYIDVVTVESASSIPMNLSLFADNIYEVVATIAYNTTASIQSGVADADLGLKLFISGSAVENYDEVSYSYVVGKQIGSITVDRSVQSKFYKKLAFRFKADATGIANLHFLINCGNWYIGGISVNAVRDNYITPTSTIFDIPVNVPHVSSSLDFKFEFINSNDKIADQYIEVNNVVFNYPSTSVPPIVESINFILSTASLAIDTTTPPIIYMSASMATIIQLSNAEAYNGYNYQIKNIASAVVDVVISGSQLIDGESTASLNMYDTIHIHAADSNWYKI